MFCWIERHHTTELVLGIERVGMFVIGPRTLSLTVMWRGRERGFLLHPGQSCWL